MQQPKLSDEELLARSIAGLSVTTEEAPMQQQLKLRAIPYIGQYGNSLAIHQRIDTFYRLFAPICVLKPTHPDIVQAFPPFLKQAVYDFAQKYPKGGLDLFVVNASGKYFREKYVAGGMTRIVPSSIA